jgi:hypothetical protein
VKHEYHEGPEAVQKFGKMMKHLFRAPKSTVKPMAKPTRKSEGESVHVRLIEEMVGLLG